MAEFTKEQLTKHINDMMESSKEMIGGNGVPVEFVARAERDICVYEIALGALTAGMEQEPVYLRHFGDDGETFVACDGDDERAITLYAAPQLPQPAVEALKRLRSIVADPKTLPRRKEWISGQQYSYVLLESVEAMVDDACRAAMLQGSDGTLTNEDTKRVGELVMWVKRLAHSLRKANPDSKLQSDAMDYLSRKGLIGVEDILR
ncbi:hypothetical protein [Enterobacter rongchengensis]|uniref:hypothetical protein n=1 Tax=Enterobacter rongchengensis TaxID=3030999 RepID=UPI003B239399